MSEKKTIAEILATMLEITKSMMDAARPSDERIACPMCCRRATEEREHEPFCAYRIARTRVTPLDVRAIERLAEVLRDDREVWG